MKVLGISCFFHDSAASITDNGVILAAAEEERFSRIKHDSNFPFESIKFCLNKAGLNSNDLDYVIFYEKPMIKLNRILKTLRYNYPKSFEIYKDVIHNWGTEKLWIKDFIKKVLNISKKKILFYEHHFSHAASAFYCSEFKSSDLLTIDGVGEWTTTSFGKTEDQHLIRDSYVDFPHSLGLFYTAFTEFLGFEVNDGEYKVMGMAPYGEPIFLDKIDKLFKSKKGLNFELDLSYFNFHKSMNSNLSSKFLELFGERRKKEEPFFIDNFKEDLSDEKFEVSNEIKNRSKYYADIASSVQHYIENLILEFSKKLKSSNNNQNLSYAGGVAYNCSVNSKLLKCGLYKNIFIQPAAGDSGGALGAALGLDFIISGKKKENFSHVYLGKSFSDQEIKSYLENNGIEYKFYKSFDQLCEHVSNEIANEKIVGWFQGSFEFGPRSLGNRSILADPRFFKNKKIVNSKIKFRELFRPFAPSTIKEFASVYYELDKNETEQQPYSFMLSTVKVREEYRNKLQATTHLDGTARLQIVTKNHNEKFHKLISSFGQKTGIFTLLNTSFNRRGEPIVGSPQDAMATFNWTGIDLLVLNNFVIKKNNF
tara:strand:+ start:1455 stop:3236 length:1782 start_codon:yes stop_codon:yes gene_type:complete